MLTLDGCIELSDLTVDADIAAHEHGRKIITAELRRDPDETVTGKIHIRDSSSCRIQAIIIVWPEGDGHYEQEFA